MPPIMGTVGVGTAVLLADGASPRAARIAAVDAFKLGFAAVLPAPAPAVPPVVGAPPDADGAPGFAIGFAVVLAAVALAAAAKAAALAVPAVVPVLETGPAGPVLEAVPAVPVPPAANAFAFPDSVGVSMSGTETTPPLAPLPLVTELATLAPLSAVAASSPSPKLLLIVVISDVSTK